MKRRRAAGVAAAASEALPPGQQRTGKWPVVGERDPEPFDPGSWRLEVRGLVERPLSIPFAAFGRLPREARTGTLHCVTRWSRPDSAFEGVALRVLLDRAGPLPAARFARFASGRGHDTSLPLALAREDVLLADRFAGRPLEPVHGGPVRSVLFSRYFYKSVKWLRLVELLDADRPGFWERTAGYHDAADPWKQQRYALPDLPRREVARLLAGRDLAGLDLRGAALEGRDLRGFRCAGSRMRDARLARADLREADLRGANLTNADLRGADLRGALLDGVDLDGADLSGADLRGTRVAAASMACTTFCGPGGRDPALLAGADLSGADASGLLEEQAEFLRARGIPG